MTATWLVERTQNPRFPFRIAIEQDGRLLLAVRAQSDWPAPGAQIFCMREREIDGDEILQPLDRVPIVTLNRLGPKITVLLDRPMRKRCEFLVLRRERKDGTGHYEQVFFRTETAIRAHRSRGRLELSVGAALEIAIDQRERYPWQFPGARLARRRLPAGDYALFKDEQLLAVAERKTLDNLLTDFGALRAMHQGLTELASQPRAALVIEAHYADLVDPSRTRNWPATHVANVMAEIAALHPHLPIVFAGNRKLANHWTVRWFTAVASEAASAQPAWVAETVQRYDAAPADGGLDQRIREVALVQLPDTFRVAEIVARVAGADAPRIARVLRVLRREGKVQLLGRGRGATWHRLPSDRAEDGSETI